MEVVVIGFSVVVDAVVAGRVVAGLSVVVEVVVTGLSVVVAGRVVAGLSVAAILSAAATAFS